MKLITCQRAHYCWRATDPRHVSETKAAQGQESLV